MRFLTFNLWHGLSPSSPVTMEALEPTGRRVLREQLQIEVLRAAEADVQFFQEVNPVVTRSRVLAQAVDAAAVFQPDLVGVKLFGLGLPANLNSGLVTAVRRKWSMKPLEAISLSRPGVNLVHAWGSWQLKEERFALFSETLLPGWGRVLLVNTHIHHGLEQTEALTAELVRLSEELELPASLVSELRERLAKGNARREAEIDVLMQAVARHESRFEAVVIAGDLNSRPESAVAARFKLEGFRDAWAEANPADPGYSFDSTRNIANHLLQTDFPLTLVVEDLSFSAKVKERLIAMARTQEVAPRRIDFVWFRSKTVSLKVSGARLIGFPDAEGFAPSDHFGVSCDIEVQ